MKRLVLLSQPLFGFLGMKLLKHILFPIVFIVFSVCVLYGSLGQSFLLETADYTPFFFDSVFFKEMIGRVGGFLFYLSSFLQACFCYPWLGALLFIAVLVALAYTIRWAFRVSEELFSVCWLPSLLLFLNYSQVGYLLYLLKTPAIAFTLPVGVLLAVLLVGCWKRLSHVVWKCLMIVLIPTLGYWCLGVYAEWAAILIVIIELIEGKKWRFAFVLCLLILVFAVPQVLYGMGYIINLRSSLYTQGLPDYRWSSEFTYFIPCILTFVVVLILALCRPGRVQYKYFYLFCVFMGGVYVWMGTMRDANFRAITDMKQAIERHDYQHVLDIASEGKETPTRLQVMFTRLALLKTGHLADAAFYYPDGSASYQAPRDEQYLQLIGSRALYYHFGIPNGAYRWGMEGIVEYGMRPEYLRYMYQSAVVNDEKPLAEKYAALLSRTFYQPQPLSKEEIDEVKQFMSHPNRLDYDQGVVEGAILNTYSPIVEGEKPVLELSLICNMIRKDRDAFWEHFAKWWESLGVEAQAAELPTHLQEAVLLFSQMYQVDITGLPVSDVTKQRYNDFFGQVRQNADDNYSRTALKPQFGQTYWYYFFYVDDIITY